MLSQDRLHQSVLVIVSGTDGKKPLTVRGPEVIQEWLKPDEESDLFMTSDRINVDNNSRRVQYLPLVQTASCLR